VEVTVEQAPVDDRAVVAELVRLINRAYAAGEAGLWKGRVDRTVSAEIAEAVRAGQMLVARAGDGRILGCLRTRSLDATTADVGLIGVSPDVWGAGIARSLLDSAEGRARARRATSMQLELLVPRTGTHPDKQRLHDWYTRRGYTVARRVHFELYLPAAADLLAAPADILILTKPLHPTKGGQAPLTRPAD
jgi:GNAT superfamily N-acetyltransferase